MAIKGDIPSARPKQLGIFDALVDRAAIANDVSPVPLSERAILRELEGDDSSGHRRATFGQEVEDCLLAFFRLAEREYGRDKATLLLFRKISRDPDYIHNAPRWIRDLFEGQRQLLMETFYGNSPSHRVEPGDSEDDEDTRPQVEQELSMFEETLQQLDQVLTRMEDG